MPRICPEVLSTLYLTQIIHLHQPITSTVAKSLTDFANYLSASTLQVVKSLTDFTDFTDVFSDYNGRPASTDNHQLTVADNHSTT